MLASIERGSGPPVVLLHGQPGSGSSWEPVTRRLEREFRVLAPDRIGYGASVSVIMTLVILIITSIQLLASRRWVRY